MTDYQRSRVYQAEFDLRAVFDRQYEFPTVEIAGSRITVPVERKFACLESMQRYVSGLAPGVRVRERKGQRRAHYQLTASGPEIAIPDSRWAMREIVLLHEIAHHQTQGDQHGSRFTAAYMDLLTDNIGPEAGFMYRVFLNQQGSK